MHSRFKTWFPFLLILITAAAFRLVNLGEQPLRADTIVTYGILQQKLGFFAVYSRWFELIGLSGQFPFSIAWISGVLSAFDFPVTEFSARLPNLGWSLLAVVAAFLIGNRLAGKSGGLIYAALAAFHPMLIQHSREIYFYAPLLTGVYAFVLALMVMSNGEDAKRGDVVTYYIALWSGFFLTTHAQPSGWPAAFSCLLLFLVFGVMCWLRSPAWRLHVGVGLSGVAVLGLPLLITDWGLRQLIQISKGSAKEHAVQALAASEVSGVELGMRLLSSFSFGKSVVGWTALLLCVIGLGWMLVTMIRQKTIRKDVLGLLAVIVVGVILTGISRSRTGALPETRYYIALMPIWQGLLVLGVMQILSGFLKKVSLPPGGLTAIGIVLVSVPLVHGAWLCTQLTGNPVPYKDIQKFVNSELPAGTLVLVDRYFEPSNELRVYNSTNVIFTFTVPNEPVAAYKQNRWRDTAKAFFEKYPGSAYLEIAKSYQDLQEIGPWSWPAGYFGQHHTIVNEAGLKLRRLGLATRGDFYASNTNRVRVEVFYDTREDVLNRWKQQGQSLGIIPGAGWDFVKTQDFQGWHALGNDGELSLFNVTDQPLTAKIVITGVALNGNKQVTSSAGDNVNFVPNRMQGWTLKPVKLPPGESRLQLRDPLFPSVQVPLLVQNFQVTPVEPSPEKAASP